MRADHRTGALAVDVQVADVEVADGTLDLVARTGVNSARESELGVVCDIESLIKAMSFNHGEYRPENLFLLEFRLWSDIGDHGGPDEITFTGFGGPLAAGNEASIFLALLDVSQDSLHRAFVDHRSQVRIVGGISDFQLLDSGFQLLQKLVVDAVIDDGPGAGRTLLSLEPERGGSDAFNRGVDVSVSIDDDRIFPAHFENRALDPELAWSLIRADLIDMQADFARACESDEARLGMRDDGIAECRSRARTEVHDTFGHAGLFEQFNESGRDRGRVARRLQDDGVAADDRSQSHSGHDRAGEIPRWNHGADAQRNVTQRIVLAGKLKRAFGFRQAQRFPGIELAEVEGLGNVGVGLGPVLRHFEDQPGHEFHFALTEEIGRTKQQARAFLGGSVAPRFKGLESGVHRRLNVLPSGLLMDTDDFGGLGRVQRGDLVGGLDALAANDEVILAAKLAANFGDRGAHATGVFFIAEIEKGLGHKRSGMQRGAWPDGGF